MYLSNIIISYNNSAVIVDCIDSIYKTVKGIEHEIIVVNNSASDDGIKAVKQNFSKTKLIQNEINVGFAKANNQAAKLAKGDILLFLNPDIILTGGAVSSMLTYYNSNQNIGVLGPKMFNIDGTLQYSCRSFPGVWTGLFNRYSLMSKLFPNNRYTKNYLLVDFDHNETKEVDWLSGSCMMISRSIFLKVGLFDENYFIFNEDVDLCKRIKTHGYKIIYYPNSKVYHHITSSNARVSSKVIIKRHLGMSYYFKKHHYKNIGIRFFVNFFIALRCFSQLLFNLFRARG